jgi:hypothetical protein
MFWISLDDKGQGTALSAPTFPGSAVDTLAGSRDGLLLLAPDPQNATHVWLASSTFTSVGGTILHGFVGAADATPIRKNLGYIAGLAVDETYVYWTETDGRVRRTPKNPL